MLFYARRNFNRDAWIARRRVRHWEEVNPRSARHCGCGDDHRAWTVFLTLILARFKLSSPQEGVSKDKARLGLRETHLRNCRGISALFE